MPSRKVDFRCPERLYLETEMEAKTHHVNVTDIIVTALRDWHVRGAVYNAPDGKVPRKHHRSKLNI